MAHRKRRNSKDSTKPSRERADPLIGPGGKLDPRALRRAAKAANAAHVDGGVPGQGRPVDGPEAVESLDLQARPARRVEPQLESEPPSDDDDLLPHHEGEGPVAPPARTQTVTFTLQRDLDKRLDKYLVDRITFLSRAKLQALIDAGGARVNGRAAKASTNLRLGDVVEVEIEPPPADEVPPQDIALSVLFEDRHMIVLNKSPDIIVHPARSHLAGTMINALAYHFQHRSPLGGHLSQVGREFARPGVVHRLDRQTSGVIVFAKTEEAHWKLGSQFEHRQTDKRYVAIVHGRVADLVQTIDVPIGPHPSREKGHREKQVVRHDHLGKPALSVCRVMGRYCTLAPAATPQPAPADRTGPQARARVAGPRRAPAPGWSGTTAPSPPANPSALAEASPQRDWPGPLYSADSPWISLVEIELKTGRTHQVRVHMQHLRHPLIADDMYQGRALSVGDLGVGDLGAGAPGLARVALHAAQLRLRHPITQQPMEFRAPFPADLGALLAWLRTRPLRDEPAAPGRVLSLTDLV